MGYAELGRFIEIIERSGGRPLELKVERAQKIAIPVATLVIILFAVPLATSSRRGGSAYGVGISLAITIFYLMLFRVAGAAGAGGALPPTLSAWIPNGVFLLAALVLSRESGRSGQRRQRAAVAGPPRTAAPARPHATAQ